MQNIPARVGALLLLASVVAAVWAFGSGASASTGDGARGTLNVVSDDASNPLLAEWSGPYGGVPPFDRVRVADFKPALEAGMAENLTEVERIANDTAPPTFENTIVALEKAGRSLDRVQTVYGIWSSNMNGPEFQTVQREMAPRMAAFFDKITQNAALFRRIEAVYNSPAKKKLTPEQQRLSWFYYTNF